MTYGSSPSIKTHTLFADLSAINPLTGETGLDVAHVAKSKTLKRDFAYILENIKNNKNIRRKNSLE